MKQTLVNQAVVGSENPRELLMAIGIEAMKARGGYVPSETDERIPENFVAITGGMDKRFSEWERYKAWFRYLWTSIHGASGNPIPAEAFMQLDYAIYAIELTESNYKLPAEKVAEWEQSA